MMRSGSGTEIPPPLELQCLKALWILGEANVKGVRQIVTQDRSLAYTTVMTVLDRLVRRGGVQRRKVGRSFIYTPVLSRESLRKVAVEQLVDGLFDGSQESLVSYLAGRPDGIVANATAHSRSPVLSVVPISDVAAEANIDASLL